MIDHVGFAVSDLAKSKGFYEAALAPLGITLIMTVTPGADRSRRHRPRFRQGRQPLLLDRRQ